MKSTKFFSMLFLLVACCIHATSAQPVFAQLEPTRHLIDMVSGDLTFDGRDDLILAVKESLRGNETTVIYLKDLADPRDRIGIPLFSARSIDHLAIGDVNGDGFDELFFAEFRSSNRHRIWRLGRGYWRPIWNSDGNFRPGPIALGDADGNGIDELYTTFVGLNGSVKDQQRIYKNASGVDAGARIGGLVIYRKHDWFVRDLVLADTDGNGRDELFTVFTHSGRNFYHRVYRSASTNSVGGHVTDIWHGRVREIASGDVDGDGRDELFLAYHTTWFYRETGITACIVRCDNGVPAANPFLPQFGNQLIGFNVGLWTDSLAVGYPYVGGTGALFTAFGDSPFVNSSILDIFMDYSGTGDRQLIYRSR